MTDCGKIDLWSQRRTTQGVGWIEDEVRKSGGSSPSVSTRRLGRPSREAGDHGDV